MGEVDEEAVGGGDAATASGGAVVKATGGGLGARWAVPDPGEGALEGERGRGGCRAAAAGSSVNLARAEASPNLVVPVKLSGMHIYAMLPFGALIS